MQLKNLSWLGAADRNLSTMMVGGGLDLDSRLSPPPRPSSKRSANDGPRRCHGHDPPKEPAGGPGLSIHHGGGDGGSRSEEPSIEGLAL